VILRIDNTICCQPLQWLGAAAPARAVRARISLDGRLNVWHANIGLSVTFSLALPLAAAGQDCAAVVLRRAGEELAVERVRIEDGRPAVYQQANGDGFVSLLLPWSAGQSGEVVQAARPSMISARCEAGELRTAAHQPDGSQRSLPPLARGALERFDMRVSVTTAEGGRAVFLVGAGQPVVRDTAGPVLDMFGGKVPLQPGDVAITTEVRPAAAGTVGGSTAAGKPVQGDAALEAGGSHLFARGWVVGGGAGEVLVDLGASRTVVSRAALPAGVEVRELQGVEYGPEGKRPVKATMGGLSGGVADFMGLADLPLLQVGSLSFVDASVSVVPTLPRIDGRDIIAVLGADLLRRGARTLVVYPHAGAAGRLVLGGDAPAGPALAEVPFSLAGGLVMLRGLVGGETLDLVLDTGARETLLTSAAAASLGLERATGTAETFRGADGAPLEAWPAMIRRLDLGTGALQDLRVYVADVPVLEQMGLSATGGLLGQNLRHYARILEVDWVAPTVRLYR
jgi:predicted aspartyl protease